MPFVVTLHTKKPGDHWNDPKPPTFWVPPHRVSWKAEPFPKALFRKPRGGVYSNLSCKSEAWTYSTSGLDTWFGGTFRAKDVDWKDMDEYFDSREYDTPLYLLARFWARLYPHGWFQNG